MRDLYLAPGPPQPDALTENQKVPIGDVPPVVGSRNRKYLSVLYVALLWPSLSLVKGKGIPFWTFHALLRATPV
jgi:hypothetical protein